MKDGWTYGWHTSPRWNRAHVRITHVGYRCPDDSSLCMLRPNMDNWVHAPDGMLRCKRCEKMLARLLEDKR